MEAVCIGLEHRGLTLFDVRRESGSIWWCAARLSFDGLVAEVPRVAAHYAVAFNDLMDYLTCLAEDWRGWEGERTYESFEGQLRLTATYDRHVKITVTLRQSTVENGWTATATFSVDPGEQMTAIAADVRELFAVP